MSRSRFTGIVALVPVFVIAMWSFGFEPIEARAVSRSDPRACTVCIKRAPHYVPQTSMQWSAGGRICVQKTFSRRDDWLMEDCGGQVAVAELETIADLPSCEICHENSTQVEAWHKNWTKDDGSQCASAEFVAKD